MLDNKSIKRGSIYWVDLNPSQGSEIDKTRPCMIISNNINNEYSNTITVIPITSSTSKIYPFEALIPKNFLGKESKLKANQIRTIDKTRLREFIVELPTEIIEKVEKALKIHLGF